MFSKSDDVVLDTVAEMLSTMKTCLLQNKYEHHLECKKDVC